MELIPAIDLIGGQVVRLRTGDYGQVTTFAESPAELAQRFAEAGCRWLHVIDLEAARDGTRDGPNGQILQELTRSRRGRIQLGGGFRDRESIEAALAAGVDRVLVGTLAIREPEVVIELAARHRERICVTADSLAGSVRVAGWLEDSHEPTVALIRRLARAGVCAFLVTAIDRDGTLAGPDLDLLARVRAETDGIVLASGGVGSALDVARVREIGCDGVVVGRALLDGTLALADALSAAESKAHGRESPERG